MLELNSQEIGRFFDEIIEREEALKQSRTEIKDLFDSFSVSTAVPVKAIKDGFKFYKSLLKDKTETETVEFMREQLVALLKGGINGQPE